jgi:Uma2 family endonuclease
MSDMALQHRLREFTVAEFHRMVETGVIATSERIELLDGRLIRMAPIGRRHWDRHAKIVEYLNRTMRGRATIVGQGSFPLGDRNEPQPDVAILALRDYELEDRSPSGEDVFAFLELAESSLPIDLGAKSEIYAGHLVRDYLVVDLEGDRLILHREPHASRYQSIETLAGGDEFALSAIPEVPLAAARFLRPRR